MTFFFISLFIPPCRCHLRFIQQACAVTTSLGILKWCLLKIAREAEQRRAHGCTPRPWELCSSSQPARAPTHEWWVRSAWLGTHRVASLACCGLASRGAGVVQIARQPQAASSSLFASLAQSRGGSRMPAGCLEDVVQQQGSMPCNSRGPCPPCALSGSHQCHPCGFFQVFPISLSPFILWCLCVCPFLQYFFFVFWDKGSPVFSFYWTKNVFVKFA